MSGAIHSYFSMLKSNRRNSVDLRFVPTLMIFITSSRLIMQRFFEFFAIISSRVMWQ